MALGVVALSASFAFAGPPTDFVKERTKAVSSVMVQKESKKRQAKLQTVLEESVDFRELASRSLRGYWEKRTEAEQNEFLSLLERMLRANYSKKLSGKRLDQDFKVVYTSEKARGDLAVVKTKVVVKKDERPVNYKLIKRGEKDWIVFDIIIDDISLEETYRESYTEIIKDEGWNSLISKMKDKIKELEAGA